MTLSDKLTRDQVRDAFNRNLTYADLEAIDIRALQGFIAIECARHDRKLASKGELLMLMQPSCRKKQLQTNLKQEKARAATLEVRIAELENASRGRMAAYRRELVEEMQRQAVCASGGWSKARVLGFLGGFLPETEEVTSYDGSFVEEYDSEPEPRRSPKKA